MSARAHCPSCGHSEELSLELVESEGFDFWCPRCRNMLVIEAIEEEPRVEPRIDARVEPRIEGEARVDAKKRGEDEPRFDTGEHGSARRELTAVAAVPEPVGAVAEAVVRVPERAPEPEAQAVVSAPPARTVEPLRAEPSPPVVAPPVAAPPESTPPQSGIPTQSGAPEPIEAPAPPTSTPPQFKTPPPFEAARFATPPISTPPELETHAVEAPSFAREVQNEPAPESSQERWPFRSRWRDAVVPVEEEEGGADPFAVLAAEVQAAIFAESRDAPGLVPEESARPTERHAWPDLSDDASDVGSETITGAWTTPTERFPELGFVEPATREAPSIEDDPVAAELVASFALDRGPLEDDSDGAPPTDLDSTTSQTSSEPEAPDPPGEPDAFDELDVVEVTGGTRGTGSRTYDAVGRTPLPPAPAPPKRGASGATPRPGVTSSGSSRRGGTGAFPRPTELEAKRANTGAFALPPPSSGETKRANTGAFARPTEPPEPPPADDLDWYALIDEALPETAGDGPDPSRVVIHLPETLAPRSSDDADAETLRRIQETLEARGIAKLSDLVASEARPDDDDTRKERTGPLAVPVSDDPAATAAIQAKAKTSPESGRVPPPGSGRIPPPGSGRIPPPAPANEPRPSDRTPVVQLESPPPPEPVAPPANTVEQFNRDDLDPCLVCARDPSSPEADYLKQLYQTLFHPRPGPAGPSHPPRIVLVTSARRGEGKTTVAANLAIVAARLPGRGALLIGADPRGGDLLRVFGLGMKREGLLEALDSAVDPIQFVLRFKLGNLDVLPLGVPGSDAAELISSDRIGVVIHGLAARYPTAAVIIDGSSVLHAPDPLVLARQVDGVVLVVRADATAREDVARARDLIGPERILGIVLNQVSRSAI